MKLKELKLSKLEFVNRIPKDGKDGRDGVDGQDGKHGTDGRNGISIRGECGPPGIDGINGRDGKDGNDANVSEQLIKEIIQQAKESTEKLPVVLKDLEYKTNSSGEITHLRKKYTDKKPDKWTKITTSKEVQKIINQVVPSGTAVTKITSNDGSVTIDPIRGYGEVDLSVSSAVDGTGLPWYYIPEGETVTVPQYRQHLTKGQVTVDGELINNGEVVDF